ncbi:MAG: MATE family efflux transporter [Butyrivibrio sp.]|uniref:MATE family efflux transporter n=1 Tax=Butyrivibrio sp. TaxID=28121 RepID=UPI001B1BBDE0|nr:MATE family efflux transporter [Butyrivibrio sp.]MBO6240570.1 MATE family efflux transporter [Butyrivibrio sp.]
MSNVFEEKNIQKLIVTLGIPAMLGTLATLIYNMADTYFVSMTKNPAQIAAVTLCTPILLIIMSVSSIFGMGGSSVIARMLGEKKSDQARKCITFCIYAMAVSGIVILVLGSLFMNQVAGIAGADEENLLYTNDYLRWIFFGAPVIILSNGMVHLFRSAGLIKEATIGIVIGNGINILLDWVFIVLMEKGTAGAALATSVGFLCSTVYYFACMVKEISRKNELYSLSPKSLSVTPAMTFDVVKIGIPGALITVMISVSNIVLNNYIGIYGSDAVAAYGIAYKIDMFPIMLSVGLSQGVAPLMGYCYGAGQKTRLRKVMRYATVDGIILGALFTALFLVASQILTGIFLSEKELVALSASFLRVLALSAPCLGIINTVTSYFQALGKAVNSLVITLMRNLILFIPGVIILNKLFGLDGAIAAQPVVEVMLAVVCIAMYLGGAKTEASKSVPCDIKVSDAV